MIKHSSKYKGFFSLPLYYLLKYDFRETFLSSPDTFKEIPLPS